MNKKLGFFASLMMLLIVTFSVSLVNATGETDANPPELRDITKQVKLSNFAIKDQYGKVVEDGNVEYDPMSHPDSLLVMFTGNFDIPVKNLGDVKEGDYFYIKAPTNLELLDQSYDIVTDQGGKVVYGKIEAVPASQQVRVVFNKNVEQLNSVSGTFSVKMEKRFDSDQGQSSYETPDGQVRTITFTPKLPTDTPRPVTGEVVHKTGWTKTDLNEIVWEMELNRSGKLNLTGATAKVIDNIDLTKGSVAQYLPQYFKLSEVAFNSPDANDRSFNTIRDFKIVQDQAAYEADSDHSALLTLTNGGSGFELLLPTNTGNAGFYLYYRTTSPQDGSQVVNRASLYLETEAQEIFEPQPGEASPGKEASSTVTSLPGLGAVLKADLAGRIRIEKYDQQDVSTKLAGVVFTITNKDNAADSYTVTTDENGLAVSPILKNGTYVVTETKAAEGYYLDQANAVEVVLNNQQLEQDGNRIPYSLNVKNVKATSVKVTKRWSDTKKHEPITVDLLQNGQAFGPKLVLSDENNWQGTFTNLPEVDENGNAYQYSVKEQTVAGYTPEYSGTQQTGLIITNNAEPGIPDTPGSHEDEQKVTVSGQKVWDDANNQDGIRPQSVRVHLFANGVDTGKYVDVSADSNWTYAFTDLDKSSNGKDIVYTVKEDTVVGYESKVDGTTIINTHVPSIPSRPNEPSSPNPPAPNQPAEPGQPENHEPDSNHPAKQTHHDHAVNDNHAEVKHTRKLPKTGAASVFVTSFIGILMMIMGTALFNKRKA